MEKKLTGKRTPLLGAWGVADLGTNTFQFLIAEKNAIGINEIVNTQETVRLGEGGINKGIILSAPFERGIAAMLKFKGLLKQYGVEEVRAIATSALRNAANGPAFVEEVKSKTGIAIEIIDGDKEAGFVYKGIVASGILTEPNSLIIGIGGGSVEFIIGNRNGIIWKASVEIGCARLMDKFHQIDPIPAKAINKLNEYLSEVLNPLFIAVALHEVQNIIGASGPFETYVGLIELGKGNNFNLKKVKVYRFQQEELVKLLNQLIISSHAQRANNPGIIPIRVDMIVSASLITRYVMEELNLHNVIMTTNSLKEGVMADMLII